MSMNKDNVNNDTSRRVQSGSNPNVNPINQPKTNEGNQNQSTEQVNVSDIFKRVAQLTNSIKDVGKVATPVVEICNMINTINQNGIYRSDDTVLLAAPYALLVSMPERDYSLSANQSLLASVIEISMFSDNDKFLESLGQTLDYLHIAYDDFCKNNAFTSAPMS